MSLFQSNLRKQIRNLPKILNFVKIIHYFSKLFTSLLSDTAGPVCGRRYARRRPRQERAGRGEAEDSHRSYHRAAELEPHQQDFLQEFWQNIKITLPKECIPVLTCKPDQIDSALLKSIIYLILEHCRCSQLLCCCGRFIFNSQALSRDQVITLV